MTPANFKLETLLSNPNCFVVCSFKSTGEIHRLIGIYASDSKAADIAAKFRSRSIGAHVVAASALV